MIKKLLLIPLMGIISFGAFASASTIDISWDNENGYIPGAITVNNTGNISASDFSDFVCDGGALNCELLILIPSSSLNCRVYLSSNGQIAVNTTRCQNLTPNVYPLLPPTQTNKIPFTSLKFTSSLLDIPETPDDGDSSFVPGISDSFTSGLTNLLTNFGSTIVSWLPIIILAALGIYAIFALFRVVRNYARSSFNG